MKTRDAPPARCGKRKRNTQPPPPPPPSPPSPPSIAHSNPFVTPARTIAELKELLRLRVLAELHRLRRPLDTDALEVVAAAAEDEWTSLRSVTPHPFFDPTQSRLLCRALPWLAVERGVDVYLEHLTELERLDARGVFTSSANRVRCIARLGSAAESALSCDVIRKAAIDAIGAGVDPTLTLAHRYFDLER